MVYNVKGYEIPKKWVYIAALAACVWLFSLIWSIPTWLENSSLKRAQKENKEKIEQIDAFKKEIFLRIKADSILLQARKDSILVLTNKRETLKKSLNYYKYENLRIKNNYLRGDLNERVELFTRLATEKDTIPRR